VAVFWHLAIAIGLDGDDSSPLPNVVFTLYGGKNMRFSGR